MKVFNLRYIVNSNENSDDFKPDSSIMVKVFAKCPGCDVTSSAPRYVNLFEPFHFLAGDQLVVPIGASHISLRLQEIQSREWEKKEQTNNMLGLTQVQKGSYVTLCICRLLQNY